MSFVDKVAALRSFFGVPDDAPLPAAVVMMNNDMGIDGGGRCQNRWTTSSARPASLSILRGVQLQWQLSHTLLWGYSWPFQGQMLAHILNIVYS